MLLRWSVPVLSRLVLIELAGALGGLPSESYWYRHVDNEIWLAFTVYLNLESPPTSSSTSFLLPTCEIYVSMCIIGFQCENPSESGALWGFPIERAGAQKDCNHRASRSSRRISDWVFRESTYWLKNLQFHCLSSVVLRASRFIASFPFRSFTSLNF